MGEVLRGKKRRIFSFELLHGQAMPHTPCIPPAFTKLIYTQIDVFGFISTSQTVSFEAMGVQGGSSAEW